MLKKHATILVQIQPIGFIQSVTFYNYQPIRQKILSSRHIYDYNFTTSRSKISKPLELDNLNKYHHNIITLITLIKNDKLAKVKIRPYSFGLKYKNLKNTPDHLTNKNKAKKTSQIP